MKIEEIPKSGFTLTGLSLEQTARKFAERGEAVELMRELCETMGCTLRVDPSVDDDPQFVLSRNGAIHSFWALAPDGEVTYTQLPFSALPSWVRESKTFRRRCPNL